MAIYHTYEDFLEDYPEFDGSATAEAAFEACGGDTEHATLRTLVQSGGVDLLDEVALLQAHGLSSTEILETVSYNEPKHLAWRLVQVIMEMNRTHIHEDNAQDMCDRLQDLGFERPRPKDA